MTLLRTPSTVDLQPLEARLAGRLIAPADPAYDEARLVHDAGVDRHPAAIVRPADAGDVAAAIDFARERGLPIAVRSGGHSAAGHGTGDDALVIDTSSLRALRIEPERRLAWAGAGLTAGEVTGAAHAHGLAVPFGDTASVGLGGLTLGGGVGWLARKHGLTIDSLDAVELVTADGERLVASEDEHPDLFWALRGGGGNFGVVTRFRYRLHPVGTILGGAIALPATAAVLRGAADAAAAAPDELTTITMVMPAPPLPVLPPEVHGRLATIVMFVYAGDPDEGQQAVAPFRGLAEPLGELVAPMPYPGIYDLTKEGARRGTGTGRSAMLEELDDATIDDALAALEAPSSPATMVQVRVLGGAVARVPADATAYAFREAGAMVTFIVPFQGEAGPHEAWAERAFAPIRARSVGVYSNFLAEPERVREAYPPATYERLVTVKRRYDPTNAFRLNINVPPV